MNAGDESDRGKARRRRSATFTAKPSSKVAAAVALLAVGLLFNALLGPLAFDVIDYRYGESMTNQAIGLDFVTATIASPLALSAAWLTMRGHIAGPVLAMAPALFAAYMMPQYVVGPDYVGLPGNNEDFAVGHIALFILALGVVIAAWNSIEPSQLRPSTRTSDRRRIWILVGVAAFIGLGRQLPAIGGIVVDPSSNSAYVDNPTAFWLVGFLDLGVVAPAALAAGWGLWRRAPWARTAAYAVIGWFSLVPVSVVAMTVVMRINDDPLVTNTDMIVLAVAGAVFTVGAVTLYRPLFMPAAPGIP